MNTIHDQVQEDIAERGALQRRAEAVQTEITDALYFTTPYTRAVAAMLLGDARTARRELQAMGRERLEAYIDALRALHDEGLVVLREVTG